MTDLKPFTIAILVSVACVGAHAAETLEEWEMTTQMTGGPMAMPAQKMIVCQKKTHTGAPPAQSNCKYTKLGKIGNRGTFTMECSGQYPSTISGEGTQTADTMEGTMTILSAGTEIRQSYSGKRLGSCAKEGARNVGSPALTSAAAADDSPAPTAADDAPPKKEGIKDAASKAADSAKNALKSLFSH